MKNRRKDGVSKVRVSHISAVATARAQRVPEHGKDGHWAGFVCIPRLCITPRMGVFAHLSSPSPTQPPGRVLSRLWYLLSSQKRIIHLSSHSHAVAQESPCLPAGQEIPTATGHETQKLPGRFLKTDRAYAHVPHSQHT